MDEEVILIPILYICEVCGKEIWDKPSHPRKCCSRKCLGISQRTRQTIVCDWCGKEYEEYLCELKKWSKHFCGNECRLKWLSTHMIDEVNVPGHSVGHKAPHLTELNKRRNPLLAIEPDKIKRGIRNSKKHRHIMEEYLGRKLESNEDVHHINGIPSDNRIENLMVMDHIEHIKFHWDLLREKGVM